MNKMKLTCIACQRSMNIPDEKLPKDRAFSITCPDCKIKIKVAQHLSPAKSAEPIQGERLGSVSMVLDQENFDNDDDLVIYDENDKLALILDEVNQSTWTEVLESRDFKIQYARSPEHAIHKMKFTHFHFIAMNESYEGKGLDDNLAYKNLIEMPMATRRNIFFALTGKNLKTLNNMQAFQKSVNVVINEKNLDNLADILKKSISENENFYKVFKETLHSMGKL